MKAARAAGRLCLRPLATLLALSLAVFAALQAIPGGPLAAWGSSGDAGASPADLRQVQALLGMDLPWPRRYLEWLLRWPRGDWGVSWSVSLGTPVRALMLPHCSASLQLAGAAFLLAGAGSVAFGAWLALRPRGGETLLGLATAVHCVPTFLVGVLILTLFQSLSGQLPESGPGASPAARAAWFALPLLTLVLVKLNAWSRVFRAECERVLAQPFIVTARAKGLGPGPLLLRHVLPNALGPFLSLLALDLPALVSGTLVVEVVFNYPGMGQLLYHAVREGDWPVVQAAALAAGLFVVAGNAAADGLRAALDPRPRGTP